MNRDKSSNELANDLLAFLKNIDDTEDAKEFARIWLGAVERAGVDFDPDEVMKCVADVDRRFREMVIVARHKIPKDKFKPASGVVYVGRPICSEMATGKYWAELVIRKK